jgi:putative transposase
VGTYTKLAYHIVFGTKFRRPTIAEEYRERLYEYIGGIIRAQNGQLIKIGGVADHLHLLVYFSSSNSISTSVRDIKANSSRWLNELSEMESRFEWQIGYSAFAVSYSQIEAVAHYIDHQPQHHQSKTFEQEYIEFLNRHGIAFEPKYVFEDERTD